jgi:radical SAM superfamily enzyme YgiQ (UPF0313 family)
MTRKYGFETAIIDAAALKLKYKEIAKLVIDNKFKYVGITAVTISVGHAARLAEMIKNYDKSIVTIIGGPHLTAVPVETMSRYPQFDIGVIGEADYTIIELLNALENKENLDKIPGLIIRKNGSLFSTLPRKRIENLDDLPKPAWDLLPNLAKYYCPPVHTLKRIPAALLIASRGCPGRCIFCDRSVFGNLLHAYSAEYTFELIKDLYYNYGIREIQLRDDNFTAYRNRTVELCEILKQERLDLVWTCAGRVDMVNPPLLRLMKEAGCWQIWYGIESGSQGVLNTIQKNTTIDQIQKAVYMTRDAGISPCGFFIIGSPTETKESLESTVRLALELPLDEAHFSFMTPFPGSELYTRAAEYGLFENDWSKLSGWLPVFVPYDLTSRDLDLYSKKAFLKFYFRARIILSYIRKIRSWQQLRIYFRGLLALLEWLILRKSNKVRFNKNL